MSEPEDPARRFLDQTVPRHDEWEGREPDDGPARPRHVQYPDEQVAPMTAKERRANTLRGVAWGVGPAAAFVAGAALSDGDSDPVAALERAEPDRAPDGDTGFDGGFGGGFGEAGSGW